MNKDELIEEMAKDLNVKLKLNIMRAILETEFNIDETELIKALQSDRNQYEQGYADGKKETAREILQELYIECEYYTHGRIAIENLANKYGIELE